MSTELNLEADVLAWWESHRPLNYSEADHVLNPTVNLSGPSDHALARHAAKIARRASSPAAVPDGALPPLPKTWQERCGDTGPTPSLDQAARAMKAEIAEWRARAAVEADRAQRDKLLTIIAYAYQIAGAHDCPAHILDVLADPEAATDEQIDAMLPYIPDAVSADRAQQGEPVACAISYWQGYQSNVDLNDDGTGPFTRWSEYKPSTLEHGKAIVERGDKDKRVKWLYDRAATKAAAPEPTAGEVPQVVREALDIALDLAIAEADNVHTTYAGYKPHRHEAVDRDVETIKRAIDALNPADPYPSEAKAGGGMHER